MRLLFASAAALLVLALCLDARSPRSATAAAPGVRAGEEDDSPALPAEPQQAPGGAAARCGAARRSVPDHLPEPGHVVRIRVDPEVAHDRDLPESPDPTVAAVMRYYREQGYLVGGELSAP